MLRKIKNHFLTIQKRMAEGKAEISQTKRILITAIATVVGVSLIATLYLVKDYRVSFGIAFVFGVVGFIAYIKGKNNKQHF